MGQYIWTRQVILEVTINYLSGQVAVLVGCLTYDPSLIWSTVYFKNIFRFVEILVFKAETSNFFKFNF